MQRRSRITRSYYRRRESLIDNDQGCSRTNPAEFPFHANTLHLTNSGKLFSEGEIEYPGSPDFPFQYNHPGVGAPDNARVSALRSTAHRRAASPRFNNDHQHPSASN